MGPSSSYELYVEVRGPSRWNISGIGTLISHLLDRNEQQRHEARLSLARLDATKASPTALTRPSVRLFLFLFFSLPCARFSRLTVSFRAHAYPVVSSSHRAQSQCSGVSLLSSDCLLSRCHPGATAQLLRRRQKSSQGAQFTKYLTIYRKIIVSLS